LYCPKCGLGSKRGSFCSECGTQTVFGKFPCPYCKAPNGIDNKFCEHCGKPIQEASNEFIRQVRKETGR